MRSPRRVTAALVGVLCTLQGSAEAQNLRAAARAHAAKAAGAPLYVIGPLGDYRPKDIGELARESDVVLRGRLTRIDTYLGPEEDRILTDYRIHVDQLIAGSPPPLTSDVPASVPPLILTVYGGDLRLEGVLVRARSPHFAEDVVDGRSYLLFLMPSRRGEAGYYEIYYGGMFEVSDDRVRPLLKEGERIFKGITALNVGDLIATVKIARDKLP